MDITNRYIRAVFGIFQALEEAHRRDQLALEKVRQQPRPKAFCLSVDGKDVRVSRVWTRRDIKRQEWLDGKGDYVPIGRLARRLDTIWPRYGEARIDRLYREAKGELLRQGVYADIAPQLSHFKAAFDSAREEFLAASQFDAADISTAFAKLCETWSQLKSELPELENVTETSAQDNAQRMRSGKPAEIHYPPEIIAAAESLKKSRDLIDAQLAELAQPISGGVNTAIQGWTASGSKAKADEAEKPKWDAASGKLTINGNVAKQVKNLGQAKFVKVLAAFQEDGWPPRIDDPLSPNDNRYEVLRSLNENLRYIRFASDGTGEGIRWETIM